jgi:hypothetical protein
MRNSKAEQTSILEKLEVEDVAWCLQTVLGLTSKEISKISSRKWREVNNKAHLTLVFRLVHTCTTYSDVAVDLKTSVPETQAQASVAIPETTVRVEEANWTNGSLTTRMDDFSAYLGFLSQPTLATFFPSTTTIFHLRTMSDSTPK